MKVQNILTKSAQEKASSESNRGKSVGGVASGKGRGAYTDRFVKGKGNVLVCPERSVREEATKKDKAGRVLNATIHVDDPRALFSLPGTKDTAPGFVIVDKRKKKAPQPKE